jgi:hypothetical protein
MAKDREQLVCLLRKIETEIDCFVRKNAFYLNFKNKAWAACPQGQELLFLCAEQAKIQSQILRENA